MSKKTINKRWLNLKGNSEEIFLGWYIRKEWIEIIVNDKLYGAYRVGRVFECIRIIFCNLVAY